jgi:hypothetical protein
MEVEITSSAEASENKYTGALINISFYAAMISAIVLVFQGPTWIYAPLAIIAVLALLVACIIETIRKAQE